MLRTLTRAAVGVTAGLTLGALLAVPAQAAPHAGAAATVRSAPAAPASVRVAAASHSPTITSGPSYTTTHVAPGASYRCPSGDLCAVVYDPTSSDYKIFFLRHCGRYYLAYWIYDGGYADRQTGNPTSYFYGETGKVLHSFKPDTKDHAYPWSDVWSIRNC